jgi:hypothetical protein
MICARVNFTDRICFVELSVVIAAKGRRFPDFSIVLSTNELPVRISFPNARAKTREENLGGSVRTSASVALAGRDDGPGRAITGADNIPLNDCLSRPMIFGSSGIKFTRDFRPTRTVFANDAIHAQSAGPKNGGCKARASNTTDLFS